MIAVFSRRRALQLAAAACVSSDPRSEHTVEALLGLLSDRAGAAGLGWAHLRANPSQTAAIAKTLLASLPGTGRLRAEVAHLVRQDYAAGRVALTEGWVISITEARLCSVAALAG